MPILDLLGAAFSAPAGRVVEGSVRAIVAEVLQERGYASPAEVLALREELLELRERTRRLEVEVEGLRARLEALESRPEAPAPADPPRPDGPNRSPDVEAPGGGALVPGSPSRGDLGPSERERWRAAGLPGRIGPDGYLEIDGRAFVVDPTLEGRLYRRGPRADDPIEVDGQALRPRPLPLTGRDGGATGG